MLSTKHIFFTKQNIEKGKFQYIYQGVKITIVLSGPELLIVRALNSRKNLFLPFMEVNTMYNCSKKKVSIKFLKFSPNLNYDEYDILDYVLFYYIIWRFYADQILIPRSWIKKPNIYWIYVFKKFIHRVYMS